MVSPTKVVVIGGSVGGVSTAVALRKAGCHVTVLERAAAIVATTGAVCFDAALTRSVSCMQLANAIQLHRALG